MNILWLTHANLGPYHYATMHAVTHRFSNFKVLAITERNPVDRPWSQDLNDPPCEIITLPVGESITKVLQQLEPTLILAAGYYGLPLMQAALWAFVHRIPVVLVADSWENSSHRRVWLELLKSWWVRVMYSGALVPGSRSAVYMRQLGIKSSRIWTPCYVVDLKHFASGTSKRTDLQISSGTPFFLTVCRLSEEKNLDGLIKAFIQYRQNGGTWKLVINGRGPKGEELKRSVPRNIEPFIQWAGWTSYHDLPAFYREAGCFILPSTREPWGIVAIEAAAARLPLLISEQCGCAPELCHNGKNGFTFDPRHSTQLASLMHSIEESSTEKLAMMGEHSSALAERFAPQYWAQTLEKIVDVLAK